MAESSDKGPFESPGARMMARTVKLLASIGK